ncbi:MAG: Preprotein translocase, SecG subunit [candidate division TM6 bacterium GW2011_GWF2_37_49]|nr:MAG: Preprotein translocase, SecG subunit [candidate division TM6 bacterium GW2011_GWF2_37_49]
MFTLLLILFTILAILLAIVILIQPGKGDMGLGSIGTGTQVLFGGSGGRSFFEKITWTLGAIFILGALGLSLIKTKETQTSRFVDYTAKERPAAKLPAQESAKPAQEQPAEEEE